METIVWITTFTLTKRHLVVKTLSYILRLFIFSTPVFIRHLCQSKAVAFLHRCLTCAVLFDEPMYYLNFDPKTHSQIERVNAPLNPRLCGRDPKIISTKWIKRKKTKIVKKYKNCSKKYEKLKREKISFFSEINLRMSF